MHASCCKQGLLARLTLNLSKQNHKSIADGDALDYTINVVRDKDSERWATLPHVHCMCILICAYYV